ncbi:MAG: DUF4080 domain-containing protein [Spirochaetaceae bacterium]|jgi:radical SAM superfamily enzyme YgiQ (UPF0313 family)|nr:DUF4080 domain-containing protein [Spirochaetaceae bacterium]
MRKKVLLLAINGRYSHSNLALFYLKKIITDQGDFEVELLECTIKDRVSDLLEKILLGPNGTPDYVLFSVYIWNSSLILKLVRDLKALSPGVIQILGGPEITYNTSFWSQNSPGDFLVRGQGESVILPLLQGTIKTAIIESSAIKLNDIPFPYDKFDLEILKNRLVYYESSRGCPFNCSYCLSSCEDQPLQFRNIDRVKQELEILAFSEARIIKLVDRSFNADSSRAREIWQFIKELKGPVPFHFEVHPVFLEEEDFKLLATIPKKLFHFEIGVQSTNSQELVAVNRQGKWSEIKEHLRRLIDETEIPIHLDQIVALPGADRASVEKSFNDIISLGPDEFQMGFLKVLHGTSLEKQWGNSLIYSEEPPYEVLKTPHLSFNDLRFYKKIEDLLDSYYNSGLFAQTMDLLLSSCYPYGKNPFALFVELQNYILSQDKMKVQQWAKLAQNLWDCFSLVSTQHQAELKDSLRLDWAPLSQGQYLPGFLQFENTSKIKKLRSEFREPCIAQGISAQEYKRSILLLMEAEHGNTVLISIPKKEERVLLRFEGN